MPDPTDAPALSAVVVTPSRFAQIRKTVRHLRQQDAVDRVELVLVAPTREAVADARPGELAPFHSVTVVPVGPIPNVDKASASGVRAASADVVAFVEDHAFPQPGYATAVVAAHADPGVAVVQPTVLNGNPRHALSWCNLLLAYGAWSDPGRAGPVGDCPGHNLTVKRHLLVRHGDGLEDRMGRDGTLVPELRAEGRRFVLDGTARTAHVNPSTVRSTVALRFRAGRLYAHQRATAGRWSPLRRLFYVALGPLIPLVRLVRLSREHLTSGPAAVLRRRLLGPLAAVLAVDGAGQVAGYVAGPGDSVERLATFEMDRRQHLRRDDVAVLDDPVPPDALAAAAVGNGPARASR